MKYFYLNYEFDSKIVGVSSQIQTHGIYDRSGPNSYIHVPIEGHIDYDIQFPVFEMEKRAKRTDFVCNVPISGKFLTISPRAFDLFKELYIDDYEAFSIQVKHRGEVYPYIAMRLLYGRHKEYIDWGKSVFGIADKKGYLLSGEWIYLEHLKFRDWDEYNDKFWSLEKMGKVLRSVKLVYIEEIPFDLLKMRHPIVKHFCSERFKQIVEREGLTGFRFEEIDIP